MVLFQSLSLSITSLSAITFRMSSHGSSMEAPIAKRLEGKVAIITGGAGGIGESATRLFIRHGAKVVIADIQDNLGKILCEEIDPTGKIISYVHCDVTKETDIQTLVDTTISKYGKLDIMYNNAGIVDELNKSIIDVAYEDFKKVMDVNLVGPFFGAKHAARVMIPAKKGTILFTASVASVMGGVTPNAYATSKHAVVGLAKNLCAELGQYGIRVNCVSPFGLATPIVTKLIPGVEVRKIEESLSEASLLKGKVLKAQDVAEAALYLVSDEAKYISGLNLVVDGGYTTTNPSFASALRALVE